MARYESIDRETYLELKALRQDVKNTFDNGLDPGDEMMEQLYFLDPKTRDFVEKLSRNHTKVVTPEDFKLIASIMSEHLAEQTPILKDFTKFHGRLAEDFLLHAKPKESAFDKQAIMKAFLLRERKRGAKLPTWLNNILGIRDEAIRDKFLNKIPGYDPNGLAADILLGYKPPTRRRTGVKVGQYSVYSEDITQGYEVGYANKLDKKWTNVPLVNFDGVTMEQNFTQVFEEKLAYKDANGKWVTNIMQVPQKTDPNWWEEFRNKEGKINDIADINHARTAYGVNANHSNDAVLVKRFHLWGRENEVQTSTIHDAFFTNASEMLKARNALKVIYADAVEEESIRATLLEMRRRGLPEELYQQYLNEAIDTGLIPVAGRSRVNGKLLTEDDILTREDILSPVKDDFKSNHYWYAIG